MQLIPVAVGVYIGIWAGNLNENKKDKERTQFILVNLLEEIKVNQQQMDNVYQYHISVKDSIYRILEPEELEKTKLNKNMLGFWEGLKIFKLQNAAYQTAIQSGTLAQLDISLATSINNLYNLIGAYNSYSDVATSGLFNNDFSNVENFKKIGSFIILVFNDLYYYETVLKKDFEKTKDNINQFLNRQP